MFTFCRFLVCPNDLKVSLMGQDHLEDCLSQKTGHIAMHLGFNENGSCQAALRISKSLALISLSLVKDAIDVLVLLQLDVIVSLPLVHELCEISVFRRNKRQEVVVLELPSAHMLTWHHSLMSLSQEFDKESVQVRPRAHAK